MERAILHVDCDCFYASVELLSRPELREKAMAVGGSVEQRHGIILAKTQRAKEFGVKTAEPIWQAKKKCPDLIIIPPDHAKYKRVSRAVREICLRYTSRVEPFGLDESWMDLTGSSLLYGTPLQAAEHLQKAILDEIGITVSIGVSYNKIFAKLGSDYKKPFGITSITKENYRDIVWPLPAAQLLTVGKSTADKLNSKGILTIGDLAAASPDNLHRWFGKHGDALYAYANGLDQTEVPEYDCPREIKSVGNSTTTPRDLQNDAEVKRVLYALSETVARRLREGNLSGRVITLGVRSSSLTWFTRQKQIGRYTDISDEITAVAYTLFQANYDWKQPVRSLSVTVSDLEYGGAAEQIDMFSDSRKREKQGKLERTLDGLKKRFGNQSVTRACLMTDRDIVKLSGSGGKDLSDSKSKNPFQDDQTSDIYN